MAPEGNHSDCSGLCTDCCEVALRVKPPAISYICSRCMDVSIYPCLVQSSHVSPT